MVAPPTRWASRVAQTRILGSWERYNDVIDALASVVSSLQVGDPADAATEVGPLVAQRQQERVEKHLSVEVTRLETATAGCFEHASQISRSDHPLPPARWRCSVGQIHASRPHTRGLWLDSGDGCRAGLLSRSRLPSPIAAG